MRYYSKFMAGALALVCLGGAVRSQTPIWDTLATQCTRLVVDDRGEVGLSATGGLNLDYTAIGGDCDPNASVYLKSGGPFAIRKVGSTYTFSSSLWQTQLTTTRGWELMPAGQTPGPISGPGYTGYQTSTMWNADHSIAVQKTYYAPSATDSCNFIIQKSVFFGVGGPKTNVTIGEMIDWDVPSDSGIKNTSSINSAYTVYQRGIGTAGCQPNQNRYAAVTFLGMYQQSELLADTCFNDRNFISSCSYPNDSLFRADSLSNSDEGQYFWNVTGNSGLSAFPGQRDFCTILTYKHNRTLDTLTAYTALVTVKNGDANALKAGIATARAFYRDYVRNCDSVTNCCLKYSPTGRTGDVDCSLDGRVDISDLTGIIDCLYIFPDPFCFCCPEAANLDGDIAGGVDIADLSALIDYLYISFTPTALCPDGNF